MGAKLSNPPVPKPPPLRLPSDAELPRVPTPIPLEAAKKHTRIVALGIVVLLTFLGVARLVAPMWAGIAIGTAMAFTAQPLFRWLCERSGKRRWLAALTTTLTAGLATVVFGGGILYLLGREAVTVGAMLQDKLKSGSPEALLGARGARFAERFGLHRATAMHDLRDKVEHATGALAQSAGAILQLTGAVILGLLIALLTMYYVLMEWRTLAVRIERVMPLDPRHTRALILESRDVARSAMLGTVVTALVQGVLAGGAFAVAGVPHPITFGVLTFVGSFLPAIGTAFVWLPVGVILIATGSVVAGVAVLLWSVLVVVGVCDYVVRPRLVGKEEHPLLTLLALLGGLEVFGLGGLLVGPILMALFVAALRIYEREQVVEAPKAAAPPEVPEKL